MRSIFILSVNLFVSTCIAAAATYVVMPNGMGDFPTIQAAIDASTDGDTILLTKGTFTGEGNRDISFQGKAIMLRSRNGKAKQCIINSEGTPEEPHRAFRFDSGEGLDSVIDGITITGGDAPIGATTPAGGAIALIQSSATIRNCHFLDNYSNGVAGAISGFVSNALIIDCLFQGNESVSSSGAIGLGVYSFATIQNCTFLENSSQNVVGALGIGFLPPDDGSHVTVTDCYFADNHAGTLGGAFGVGNGAAGTLTRCMFVGNEAIAGGGAGGAIEGGHPSLVECTIWKNVAPTGGGLMILTGSHALLTNCTFYGNNGAAASGIFILDEDCSVEAHNTIIGFGEGGPAANGPTGLFSIACCDIFGHAGGDWTGAIADQLGIDGNISLDPLFVNPDHGKFFLKEGSPCAGFSYPNYECDLIGAWAVADDHGPGDEDYDRPVSNQGSAAFLSAGFLGKTNSAGVTHIRYALPKATNVRIEIFDTTGRVVRTLVDGVSTAGVHNTTWDGRDGTGRNVVSGVYHARIAAEGQRLDRSTVNLLILR